MSYTALYRKFRPDTFMDVKGQDHIVTTLKNQILADRIGHAYLFCGTRGTGKTTIAKIFAKAANCEHPVDGNPCGECSSCIAIAENRSMNVIEIDAASNNGVDNIRDIVDQVSYSPAEGKKKVYIIDEVHMLSIGAFNALLKTLEEPPSYVMFILATTEVHKIPITIMSRCQRYDFKRITVDTIAERLKSLMELESIEVEDKAIHYIAKMADGAMRDALSLLDQCIAFHYGKTLTYDLVLDVLGAVDSDVFIEMLDYILNRDIIGAIELLEKIIIQGREITQFITDFTWYLRNIMLIKSADTNKNGMAVEDVIDASSESIKKLKEIADCVEVEMVMRYIRIFSELSGQLKYATQKRILVEMTIIKLCKPNMETDYESILDRIRQIEQSIENGNFTASVNVGETKSNLQESVQVKQRPILEKAVPDDIQMVVKKWSGILANIEAPMKIYLKQGNLSLGGDNRLMIVLEDGTPYDYFTKHPENKERLESILSQAIGKEIVVTVQSIEHGRNFDDSYVDLTKVIHMDIEEED